MLTRRSSGQRSALPLISNTLGQMGGRMRDLLAQVEKATADGYYYLALYVALTLPDICGAMESSDGIANKSKYIHWFDHYVTPAYTVAGRAFLDGETCYAYRCSVLHQGRAQHPKLGYSRILFVEPGSTTNVFHNNILNDALNIDVSRFCMDIVGGAASWLKDVSDSDDYKQNYSLFMQRYPGGLPPYIVGVPVIG